MIQMLAVVVVVVAALGFVKFQQIQAAIAQGKSFKMPPEAVTTIVAKPQTWVATVNAVGSVEPVQGVTLSADQPGVVAAVEFASGAHVKAGQVLLALDTRQERAQLASVEAQANLARTALARSKKIFEQQLISQAEYDQADAVSKQADAAVNEVKASIDRKTIRAPFSGVTGIRMVNVGQYVHSGDAMVPLQSEDPIYVNFSIPQQQVNAIRVGASVRAAADSGEAAIAVGHITAVDPVVDEATRNVKVQATFTNTRGRLRAGSYVTVSVTTGSKAPLVAVPVSAISYAPYGNSVFIVEKMKGPDGKEYLGVRQQFVKTGATQGDQVAVISGVKPGEEVVSSGVFKLRPSAAVVVNNKVQPGNNPAPKPEDN
jgi:membrane fusion protein (multidrug efflux system)